MRLRGKKTETRKIIGRITYSPKKHKHKCLKSMRQKLDSRPSKIAEKPPMPNETLTFGSININGLDQEAHWAVTEILKNKKLDVSTLIYIKQYINLQHIPGSRN